MTMFTKAKNPTKKSSKWENRSAPSLLNDIGEQLLKGQHTGSGELKWLALKDVNPDPKQPRTLLTQLGINVQSIKEHRSGRIDLLKSDNVKIQEAFVSLSALADTIDQHGLIQPISVNKQEKGGYLIEAGERRYLAHILLGKSEIHAIVRAPHTSSSKKLQRQLVENIGREELSLPEKIQALIELEMLHQADGVKPLSPKELSVLIGFSERQARKYLAVVQGPKELLDLVCSGRIRKLNDAAKIAVIDNKRARTEAIQELLDPRAGELSDELIAKIDRKKVSTTKRGADTGQGNGRNVKNNGLSLGNATDVNTIKHVIGQVVGAKQFKREFGKIDWSDDTSVVNAWRGFWQTLEAKQRGE